MLSTLPRYYNYIDSTLFSYSQNNMSWDSFFFLPEFLLNSSKFKVNFFPKTEDYLFYYVTFFLYSLKGPHKVFPSWEIRNNVERKANENKYAQIALEELCNTMWKCSVTRQIFFSIFSSAQLSITITAQLKWFPPLQVVLGLCGKLLAFFITAHLALYFGFIAKLVLIT